MSTIDVDPKDYRGHARRELTMSWPVDDVRLNRWLFLFLASTSWAILGIGGPTILSSPKLQDSSIHLILTAMTFGAILAIALTYLLTISFLSRTHVTIKHDTLRVHHAPWIPWLKDISLQTGDIDRIFCRRDRRGRYGEMVHYELNARLRSGEVIPLVPRMKRAITAMFVQQRLGKTLEMPTEASVSTTRQMEEIERAEMDRKQKKRASRGSSPE